MDKPANSTSDALKAGENRPLISVIMPCYNAETYLEEAIASVFAQTLQDLELIVIDDGSSDSSFQLLKGLQKKHPRLLVLEQENQGPYPARNKGLAQAQGQYIAFLDADDYWAKDCLEKLYNTLISSKVDLSYCGWQNIVEDGDDRPPFVPQAYEDGDTIYRFLQGCPWPIHAALVKRTVVDQIKGFSTRRFSSMDYDFWLRIAAVTQNIALVPEVLAFYRWHNQGQISATKWKQVIDAWHVRKDFMREQPRLVKHLTCEQRLEVSDGFIYKQAYDAFWKRDLVSAQHLFRKLMRTGYWKKSDLKYILPSLLPAPLFRGLVRTMER